MLVAEAMRKVLFCTLVMAGCAAEVAQPDGSDPSDPEMHPEGPPAVVPRIAITNATCKHLGAGLEIVATIDATLPAGHALEGTYDFVDGWPTTSWQSKSWFECGQWNLTRITQQPGFDQGCDRATEQPESQQITMREYVFQDGGTFAAVTSVEVVAAVATKPLDGEWMERAIVRATCE